MSESEEHLLHPDVLSRIDNYSILAKTVVEGFISGLHRSLYHGFGSEFVQYRNYNPGDDLKYLDWKVYARHNKYYMKVFQEETNMNCNVVIDASESMGYRGDGRSYSKLQYASMVAASLVYMVSRQGDNIGFCGYNEDISTLIRAGHRRGQAQHIYAELHRLEAKGQGNHLKVLERLAESFSRKGLIIFISDFMNDEEKIIDFFGKFRARHHECLLIQVLDQDELDFPFSHNTRFIDVETKDELMTSPESVRDIYLDNLKAYLQRIEDKCFASQLDYICLSTSDPLDAALAAYLRRREGAVH